jgi:hypothetical protein
MSSRSPDENADQGDYYGVGDISRAARAGDVHGGEGFTWPSFILEELRTTLFDDQQGGAMICKLKRFHVLPVAGQPSGRSAGSLICPRTLVLILVLIPFLGARAGLVLFGVVVCGGPVGIGNGAAFIARIGFRGILVGGGLDLALYLREARGRSDDGNAGQDERQATNEQHEHREALHTRDDSASGGGTASYLEVEANSGGRGTC